ncbi:hypothetical protein ACOME3_009412 [Neoechinorhynchus agilis]
MGNQSTTNHNATQSTSPVVNDQTYNSRTPTNEVCTSEAFLTTNVCKRTRHCSESNSTKPLSATKCIKDSLSINLQRLSLGAHPDLSNAENSSDSGLSMPNSGPTSTCVQLHQQPTVPVVFRYDPKNLLTKVKEVYLIGSFTEWTHKVPMVKSDCDFLAILELPEGEHQYKFIADGKWECSMNDAAVL